MIRNKDERGSGRGNAYVSQSVTAAAHGGLSGDYGPKPFVTDVEKATICNENYRTVLWTGEHLQFTLMAIERGGDIGLELHTDTDQFLRIEEGSGVVYMGANKEAMARTPVYRNDAILVPAGTWHNVVNTGSEPLKLYSIYAPPHHPHGAVQAQK